MYILHVSQYTILLLATKQHLSEFLQLVNMCVLKMYSVVNENEIRNSKSYYFKILIW